MAKRKYTRKNYNIKFISLDYKKENKKEKKKKIKWF